MGKEVPATWIGKEHGVEVAYFCESSEQFPYEDPHPSWLLQPYFFPSTLSA
jgi:hypothetical protein